MFAPFVKEGVGVHTGKHSSVLVEMGLPGTGVIFFSQGYEIKAKPEYLSPAQIRATNLVWEAAHVKTVEHLLAALSAFGETDVRIVMDGNEIPILDGSALPWVNSLSDWGAELGPRFVDISQEIVVTHADSTARMIPIGPNEKPSIHVVIDFDRPELKRQEVTFYPFEDNFVEQVAPARTFAFESEIDGILAAGQAKGGSLESALVIGTDGPLNPDGQRFTDEPARHKLLDAIGDLFLLGGMPWAEISLFKPGHRLLHELTRRAEPFCSPARTIDAGARL